MERLYGDLIMNESLIPYADLEISKGAIATIPPLDLRIERRKAELEKEIKDLDRALELMKSNPETMELLSIMGRVRMI